MKRKTIYIDFNEAKRVYLLIDKMNSFFHQPMHFTEEQIENFATKNYPEIHDLYYKVIHDWFTDEEADEIFENN